MLHFWLLLTLCLYGYSERVLAADPLDGATCVDEETLRGFYEKFNLIEKEKEALRGKLASCTGGESQESALGLPLPQKDGRELRALESRVAQLEEENKALRERLNDPATDKHSLKTLSDPSDIKTSQASSVASEPRQQPVLPLKDISEGVEGLPDDRTDASENTGLSEFPVSSEVVLEEKQEKGPDILVDQTVKNPTELNLVETKSGEVHSISGIQWDAPRAGSSLLGPLPRVPPATASAANHYNAMRGQCTKRSEAFGEKIRRLSKDGNEQKALSQLHMSLLSNLTESLSSSFVGDPCTNPLAFEEFSRFLDDIEVQLESVESAQRAIQLLYETNRKVESDKYKTRKNTR